MERQHLTPTYQNLIPLLEPCLAAAAALGVPMLLYMGGLAPLERLLYPASSLALAAYLYAKRSPWYVGFCIWLFCATPLVRRLADDQSGWDASNPILLAPYLGCAFSALSALRPSRQTQLRAVGPFVAMLACIGYGLLLAVLDDRVASGLIDAMKWSVGPLFALHLLANADQRQACHRVAVTSLLIGGPAMAAYGVAQYLNPPSWDVGWVIGAASLGLDSIGRPAPFELRVFSTMNSPGSFGMVLATAILVAMHLRRWAVALPAVLVMVLGLLLSEYRSIWAGCLLGTLCLAAYGPPSARLRIALAAIALVLSAGSAAIVPEIQEAVARRLATISDLAADASGEDRLHQYQRFFDDAGEQLVIGQGLAIAGASRRLDHQNVVVIDSGLLEIFSALGVFGASIFLAGIACAAALPFARAVAGLPDMPLYRAIVVATFCQLPFGSVYAAESGFCAWLFAGLAAAAVATAGHRHRLPGALYRSSTA